MTNCRSEYIRLLLDAKLNKYLHEVDEECHARVEMLVEQMKAGAGNCPYFLEKICSVV